MKKINYLVIVWVALSFTLKVNAQPSWFWQPSPSGPYTENPFYSCWVKIDQLSDNFTGNTIDLTKWAKWDATFCANINQYVWSKNFNSQVVCQIPDNPPIIGFSSFPDLTNPANTFVSNNALTLEVDECSTEDFCVSGNLYTCTTIANVVPSYRNINGYSYAGLQSVCSTNTSHPTYGYGYYEADIKLPGWQDSNGGQSGYCGDGFHPSFWLNAGGDPLSCVHHEIDIMEPGGLQYTYANFNEAGFHDMEPSCVNDCGPCCDTWCPHYSPTCSSQQTNGSYPDYKVGKAQMTSSTALNLDYHNYAVEFFPDRIIFYFDKQPYAWVPDECPEKSTTDLIHHALNFTDPNTQKSYPLDVIFGNGVDYQPGTFDQLDANKRPTDICFPPVLSSTSDPNQVDWNMYVKNFHYWQLNCDGSSTPATITDETDLINFISPTLYVKQSITFDGTINYPPTVIFPTPPMDGITFRATDQIDIKPGFATSPGSTLRLIITPCK